MHIYDSINSRIFIYIYIYIYIYILIEHVIDFHLSRFSQSFSPMANKNAFPDGIGPVVRLALFGIGRAGNVVK